MWGEFYLYLLYAIRLRMVRLMRQSLSGRTCRRSRRSAARFPHNPSKQPASTLMETEARERYSRAGPHSCENWILRGGKFLTELAFLGTWIAYSVTELGCPDAQVQLTNTMVKKTGSARNPSLFRKVDVKTTAPAGIL